MPFIHRPRRTYSTDKGKKKSKPMVNKPTVNKKTPSPQKQPEQKSTVINNQPTLKDSIVQGAGIGMGAAIGSAAVNSLLNSTTQQVEEIPQVKNNVCNLFTEAYIKCVNNQTDSCKEIEYQLLNCLQNQKSI